MQLLAQMRTEKHHVQRVRRARVRTCEREKRGHAQSHLRALGKNHQVCGEAVRRAKVQILSAHKEYRMASNPQVRARILPPLETRRPPSRIVVVEIARIAIINHHKISKTRGSELSRSFA